MISSESKLLNNYYKNFIIWELSIPGKIYNQLKKYMSRLSAEEDSPFCCVRLNTPKL